MSKLTVRLVGESLNALTPQLEWQGERRIGQSLDLRPDAGDVADLWWLLEDPTVDLYEPKAGRRGRAEGAVQRLGEQLGRAFTATEEMRRLVERAAGPDRESVVLIVSESLEALALPWELTRLPSGHLLSNLAAGFARLQENVQAPLVRVREGEGLLRLLLVVSRPAEEEDIEYQAIAAKLLERLEGRAKLKLVRPGTFQAFERELGRSQYDLVHYDGHGTVGQLAFEDGPVEAERLGRVLASAGVPVFALNACQSAVAGQAVEDVARVSASVAHTLVATGAAGVIAMGASVRVVSAVAFFDRFYDELARGRRLSEACHLARRGMEAGGGPGRGPLDWAIPVLYLRQDLAPFAGRSVGSDGALEILHSVAAGEKFSVRKRPRGPFLGRDGDLYRVDRAVDTNPRVLLYGLAGVGKTTLIEHLLDWRRRTGGADRVVAFSFRTAPSLEELAQVLQAEVVGTRPESLPVFQGPQWAATALRDRLTALAQVLAASADAGITLLLFDNLETLAGYPEVRSGPYRDEDREDFHALLEALEGECCRVVLTSRRPEVELLGAGVRRLYLEGVMGRYRYLMLEEWASEFGVEKRLKSVADTDLQELLRVLDGHPLSTRVAAYGLSDRSVSDVLASIRGQAGKINVPVPERSTRSESLERVIAGALEHLDLERRRALGLLGMFEGRFHEDDLLSIVGHDRFPDGILADRSEVPLRRILVEAQGLGLIAPSTKASGIWNVVPGAQGALDRLWRDELEASAANSLERLFVRYWAAKAVYYQKGLGSERRADSVVFWSRMDEGNLRRARELAELNGEWRSAHAIIGLLLEVWLIAGRLKDADFLRERSLAQVSDSEGNPRDSGNEELDALWRFLLGDKADSLLRAGAVDEAWAIHRRIIEALEAQPEKDQSNLAVGYHQLGVVEQHRGNLDGAEAWYRRSLQIEEALGNRPGMASSYHELGIVEQKRGNLDAAEAWYRKSLDIDEALGNRPSMATSYHQLGMVEQHRGDLEAAEAWYRRSVEIREALGARPDMASTYHQLGIVELMRDNLDAAEAWCRKSLEITRALGERTSMASSYHQLGMIEQERGNLDAAEAWYRKSLEIEKALGNRAGMASSYHQLGIVEQKRGNLDAAEAWYRMSLEIEEALGMRVGMSLSYAQLGRLYSARGDHAGSLRATLAAFGILSTLDLPEARRVLRDLNSLYCALGRERFVQVWEETHGPRELLEQLLKAFNCDDSDYPPGMGSE